MRLLFIADGRSPIAQNWIRYFAARRGYEVYLASTFACSLDFPLAGLEVIPVAFSGFKRTSQRPGTAPARAVSLRTAIRHWLGPLTLRGAAQRLRAYIQRVQPDAVHAMRIPYEGMMAADAHSGTPLIVSTWGNDFTLHAPSTRLMSQYTRRTMQTADAVHADCHRDVRLAKEWGLRQARPVFVAPGNGGIRSEVFYRSEHPVTEPIIINPRGFRPYVRNDVFFKAIPLVLKEEPRAKFIFSLMAGEPQAMDWIRELDIRQAVELLPPLSHDQMAAVFRRAQIVASPAVHDGTPNTLLEGMACGCFPVAGDLESIREWITAGGNGLLFDPTDPRSTADALLRALQNKNLRDNAAGLNQEIISDRAEYGQNMKKAEEFYKAVVG